MLAIGIIVGAAAGMMYEHQRFVREVQDLRKKHADTPPAESAS